MKINYNLFDGKSVILKTVTNNIVKGKLYLHHMEYPTRLILEVDGKYYEEFQVENIELL